jgi:hypothetical protein
MDARREPGRGETGGSRGTAGGRGEECFSGERIAGRWSICSAASRWSSSIIVANFRCTLCVASAGVQSRGRNLILCHRSHWSEPSCASLLRLQPLLVLRPVHAHRPWRTFAAGERQRSDGRTGTGSDAGESERQSSDEWKLALHPRIARLFRSCATRSAREERIRCDDRGGDVDGSRPGGERTWWNGIERKCRSSSSCLVRHSGGSSLHTSHSQQHQRGADHAAARQQRSSRCVDLRDAGSR